jgi:hypothetical protein
MTPKEKRGRTWQWPWEHVPGDDGFEWSLRMARMVCALWLLFPVLFAVVSGIVIAVVGRPHEEPIITAVLTLLVVSILPAAPFIRERVASVGISGHLNGDPSARRPRAVYATFATATITSFIVAQAGALFGFIVTVLTRSWYPVLVGSVATYAMWAGLWPRRLLWERWTWQAKLRREEQEQPAGPGPVPGGTE